MKGGSGPFSQMNAESPAAEWYRTFTKDWPKPSAIVVVSAHWEEKNAVRVTTGARHPQLYDYYGFPEYTYNLGYECSGHPELAGRIVDMLRAGGIKAEADESRGYDHGVFIPLKLMYPEADIPVVQVTGNMSDTVAAAYPICTCFYGEREERSELNSLRALDVFGVDPAIWTVVHVAFWMCSFSLAIGSRRPSPLPSPLSSCHHRVVASDTSPQKSVTSQDLAGLRRGLRTRHVHHSAGYLVALPFLFSTVQLT